MSVPERTNESGSGDGLLWAVFAGSALLAALTLFASAATAPPPPPPGAGAVFPRIPAVPQSGAEVLRTLGIGSLTWYACILSAPGFLLLSRRLAGARAHWSITALVYGVVIALLVTATALLQYRLTYAGAPSAPPLGDFIQLALLTGTMPFVAVAAVAHALQARSQARERELAAARVQGQLAAARLEALTARLQPHFLFNTLQGISTLIPHDPAAADHMLSRLSDLLRTVLQGSDRREITLEQELALLAPYLDISSLRFGERLHFELDVPADTRAALVPFFILQPLVENALQHGVGSTAGDCTVTIAAARAGEELAIAVADDGIGPMQREVREGIGLSSTRERLRELYGAGHGIETGSNGGRGFRVSIRIPWRVATDVRT